MSEGRRCLCVGSRARICCLCLNFRPEAEVCRACWLVETEKAKLGKVGLQMTFEIAHKLSSRPGVTKMLLSL